jgi:hypothetical protein
MKRRTRIHISPHSDLGRALRRSAEDGVSIVVDAGEAIYEVSATQLSAEEDFAKRAARGRRDTIFDIVGIVASDEPCSIAEHKDEYLADAYESDRG